MLGRVPVLTYLQRAALQKILVNFEILLFSRMLFLEEGSSFLIINFWHLKNANSLLKREHKLYINADL